MAPVYHSAMGYGVGDLSVVNGNSQLHIFRYTFLGKVTGPDPPIGKRLLSPQQVFRAVGGQDKKDAPAHNFEDHPEVLSNWHIIAQAIWFNDDEWFVSQQIVKFWFQILHQGGKVVP
eukprot:9583058-Karenia_brevis.AAC.1